jgi:hypothetical protein
MFDFPSYEQIQAARRDFLLWTLVFSLFWGGVTGLIGSKRGGNGFLWFLLGAIIGPFALPFPFIFAGTGCPYCRKRISRQASICPYCRSTLTEAKEDDSAAESVAATHDEDAR